MIKRNKKLLSFLLVSMLYCNVPVANAVTFNKAFDNTKLDSLNSTEVSINIDNNNQSKFKLSEPKTVVSDDLFESREEMLKYYFQAQKKLDVDDITILWDATVERNAIIRFALKKLALPADQRRIHSSLMGKTVATLISGASILPSLFGADALTSSASSTGGTIASRYIASKDLPKTMPLTDTELIQLARLVEDLQDKLIKSYYNYKGSLESYRAAKINLNERNLAYSNSIKSNNLFKIITAKILYNKAQERELELRQDIKLHRLELERLAGRSNVNKLLLGKAIKLDDAKLFSEQALLNSADESNADVLQTEHKALKGKVQDCYSDNLKKLAEEVAAELDEEYPGIQADLHTLWIAAINKSETIRFAILKLSDPDAEAEKKSAVKKILSPIAGIAPVIGMGMGDPITAGSAIMGGGLLNSLLSDDSKLNSKLARVTDADLVLLAQQTDTLQQKLISLYFDYLISLKKSKQINKFTQEQMLMLQASKDLDYNAYSVAEVFYKDMNDARREADQNILAARMALEQFVGSEAICEVDKNIKQALNIIVY